ARRRSARRDGLRVRADLPRLPDRREADRAVPHGGRQGDRRQGARGARERSDVEPARTARRPLEAAPGRDRPLLLRLQGPRAEVRQGARLVLARGRAQGDRGLAPALRGDRVKLARNFAILALIALAIVALPGGGPTLHVVLAVLSIA